MPAIRWSRRKFYDAEGADELCFLDITASSENRATLYDVVARTAEQCFMPLTVGGGVRSVEDIRKLLLAGADKASINTAAVARPDLVREAAEKFGSQCIVVAIDAKAAAPGRWEVFTHGGRRGTGIDAVEWAQAHGRIGAGEILLTSMDRDGTKPGFDIALTRAVADAVPVPVIASGGVGKLDAPGGGHPTTAMPRRARRLDLPFRRIQHRRGQGKAARRRGYRSGFNRGFRAWRVRGSRRAASARRAGRRVFPGARLSTPAAPP